MIIVLSFSCGIKDDIERVFNDVDQDGSGCIDRKELAGMREKLELCMEAASLDRIFAKCDTDGSGSIDLEEFTAAFFSGN
jgi:Ca2+-binding EF-hand superfamily protein